MSRYPTDGIEINFDDYSPFIARREVAEHTETMTGWLREIRQACDLAAKEQGRAKRLVIRIAGSLEGNRSLGMDLESWIREELVDSVIAMPVTHGYEAGAPELRKVVEATKGTRVKVLAGINNASNPQDTREVFAAAVANAYAAGAEGVLFHTYYPDPDRYPYDDSAMESMRFMGYPDVLAHRDKRFRIGSNPKPDTPPKYGVPWQLPLELVPGEKGKEIRLEVADDLAAKAGEGELWRCELQVMLQHLMHTDKVKLWWNGKEIPEARWRKADWTYQMRPRPKKYRGYRLHVGPARGGPAQGGPQHHSGRRAQEGQQAGLPHQGHRRGTGGGIPARPQRIASGRRRPRIARMSHPGGLRSGEKCREGGTYLA